MVALLLVTALLIPYPQVPLRGDIVPPDDCPRYLGQACNNWKLATWLPELEGAQHPTTVSFVDGFVFDGRRPHGLSFVDRQGSPTTGTPFTYGKAGPPRGFALYDARHHIAFYGQGCCSWHSAVLAAGIKPPPVTVENRSLGGIRTARGLYLGMTAEQALRLYGNAKPEALRDVPGVVVRSYHHMIAYPCEQDVNLGFYRNQLIFIEFYNGC